MSLQEELQGYDAQLAECQRELGLRRRLYPRWVADGRMTQQQADRYIRLMEAIHETVRKARQAVSMRTMGGLPLD